MAKGDKRRGNREAKKPKKVREKVVATANFNKAEGSVKLSGKKRK